MSSPAEPPFLADSPAILPRVASRRIQRQELWSFSSHLIAAVAAALGTAALAARSTSRSHLLVSLVYGASMIAMFSASALYHAFKDQEDGTSLWRRLDHLAIFFMIAGTYTPVCYIHLDGAWRSSILGVVWGLVAAGLILKLVYIGAPRVMTASIYLAMGWIGLIPMHQLLMTMDSTSATLMITGGVAYTIGAVCYAVKRPNPAPGLFGFHEIFHLFVVAGAALHYALVYRIVG